MQVQLCLTITSNLVIEARFLNDKNILTGKLFATCKCSISKMFHEYSTRIESNVQKLAININKLRIFKH